MELRRPIKQRIKLKSFRTLRRWLTIPSPAESYKSGRNQRLSSHNHHDPLPTYTPELSSVHPPAVPATAPSHSCSCACLAFVPGHLVDSPPISTWQHSKSSKPPPRPFPSPRSRTCPSPLTHLQLTSKVPSEVVLTARFTVATAPSGPPLCRQDTAKSGHQASPVPS